MAGRFRFPLLPSLLFRLSLGVAAILILLVLVSPLVDNGSVGAHGWRRLVGLFARDLTLRRTAVASAIGLVVTGCIFFRVPGASRAQSRSTKQPKVPPTLPPIVGA